MSDQNSVEWEKVDKYFIFHENVKHKLKMHTRRLDLQDWVKLDETYPIQMKVKTGLLETHINHIFKSKADKTTTLAKWEFFELLVDYLPKRFPNIFEPQIGFIYNKLLKTRVSIERSCIEDPLIRAAKLTQEDWIILEWDEKKQGYILTAGLLAFPSKWRLTEKFGKVMPFIHEPVVPYMTQLNEKVNGLLLSMKPHTPFWRANWGIYNDLKNVNDLYAPPNENPFVSTFDKVRTGKELILRIEYQTLRKLPKTNSIVFSIRVFQHYLEKFKSLPRHDSQGLLNAINYLDADMYEYKGAHYWGSAAKDYLKMITEEKHKEVFRRYWLVPLILTCTSVLTCFLIGRRRFRNLNFF